MKKKIFIIILLIFCLIFTNITTAFSIKQNNSDEKQTNSANYEDITYAGSMKIDPGSFPIYNDWEIDIDLNPDFGGSERIFYIREGKKITITADFEIMEDGPFPEDWVFTLYTYGWDGENWQPIKNTFQHIFDDPGPDNSCTGELNVSIRCDKYEFIYARLWVDYWRLGWDGWEMLHFDTNIVLIEILENQNPNTPVITGTTKGKPGETYDYYIYAVDPEDDDVYFFIEWYENYPEAEWQGPYPSGEVIKFSHSWDSQGMYIIRVKAKDSYDDESPTIALIVTMPRVRFNCNLLSQLLKQFPILQNLLKL